MSDAIDSGFRKILCRGLKELGMASRRSAREMIERMTLENGVSEFSLAEDDGEQNEMFCVSYTSREGKETSFVVEDD